MTPNQVSGLAQVEADDGLTTLAAPTGTGKTLLAIAILVTVLAVLFLVATLLIWTLSVVQTRAMEQSFHNELTTLATTSRFMLHSAAEAYCKTRDITFHRVLPDSTGTGPAAGFERDALAAFARDPALQVGFER